MIYKESDLLTAEESLRLQLEYIQQLADTIPSRLRTTCTR